MIVAHRPSLFRRLLARMTGQTLFLVTLTTMFPYFLGFSLLGVDKVFVVQSDGSLEIDFSILGPSLATFFTTAAAIRLGTLPLCAPFHHIDT